MVVSSAAPTRQYTFFRLARRAQSLHAPWKQPTRREFTNRQRALGDAAAGSCDYFRGFYPAARRSGGSNAPCGLNPRQSATAELLGTRSSGSITHELLEQLRFPVAERPVLFLGSDEAHENVLRAEADSLIEHFGQQLVEC